MSASPSHPYPAALIALYHAVGTANETGYRDAVSADELERQLAWLTAHYDVVPLDEIVARRRTGRSLAGLAALTFDDNHRSVLETALPLASRLGLPAAWFVIAAPLEGAAFWRRQVTSLVQRGEVAAFLDHACRTEPAAAALRPERFYRDSKDPSRIDSSTMMALLDDWFAESGPPADFVTAAELSRGLPSGVQLGNHSYRHPVLAGLPEPAQRVEIRRGRETLERLGLPATSAFAIPFGNPETWDRTTESAGVAEGVSALLTTGPGLAAVEPEEPPQAEGRLPVLRRALLGHALAGTAPMEKR